MCAGRDTGNVHNPVLQIPVNGGLGRTGRALWDIK